MGGPRSQILRELGYPEDEIPNMIAEADGEVQVKMKLEADLQAQNKAPENESTGDQSRSRQGVPGGGQ